MTGRARVTVQVRGADGINKVFKAVGLVANEFDLHLASRLEIAVKEVVVHDAPDAVMRRTRLFKKALQDALDTD